MQSYKKCPNCGTINLNRNYCEDCNAVIDAGLIRRLEQMVKAVKKRKVETEAQQNAKPSFFEMAKKHPNLMVRVVGRAFYSVWILVLAIGGALALIFAYVAA